VTLRLQQDAMERKGSAMEVGARSDTGRVRENNEDSFRLAPELNLFVLSDGMGGLESGERASRLATETIVRHSATHRPMRRWRFSASRSRA